MRVLQLLLMLPMIREIKFVNSHYTNCQNDTHTERYTYIIIILYRYNKRNIS